MFDDQLLNLASESVIDVNTNIAVAYHDIKAGITSESQVDREVILVELHPMALRLNKIDFPSFEQEVEAKFHLLRELLLCEADRT